MTSKEALEKLSYIPIYEEDEHNVITDIDSCCIYKGDLCEVYESEVDVIKKDLEILDFLIEKLYVASGLFELQVCPPNNPMIKKYHNAIETHDDRFDKYYKRICELKYGNK